LDIETIAKFIGMLGVLYPIGKGIREWMNGKTSKMREEYRFAQEFLSATNEQDPHHPFALEKGYQALAGSRRVTVPEIKYLLDLEESPSRLKDFVLGYSYLQHLCTGGENEISFRAKYIPKWTRLWRKVVYFIGYVGLALAALSPFLLAGPLGLSLHIVGASLALTLPTLGTYAVLSLMAALKLVSAERLVKLQRLRSNARPQMANRVAGGF
jgi:hypothetical protein